MMFKKPLQNPLQFDVVLAERALEQVIEHPETHNQRVDMVSDGCAQTGCIMGWVKMLATGHLHGSTDWVVQDALGLTSDEFCDVYGEQSNKVAIRRFKSYINHAKKVQARAERAERRQLKKSPSAYELSAADRAALDTATEKVGV